VVRGALIDLTGKSSMKMNLADVSSPKVKDSKVDKKRRESETDASEYKGISRSRTVSKEELEEKEDPTLERDPETDKATRESKWTTHEGDLYDTVTPNSSVKLSQKLGSTSSPRSSRSIHTDNSPTTIIPSKAEKVLLRHLNLMAMQSSSPSSSDSQKPRDDYWIFFKGVLYGPENPVPLTKNPTNMQYLKVLVFAIKDNATIPATLFVDEQSASEKLCALVNTTKIHFVDFDSAEGFTDPHTQIAKEILREHGVPIV